MSWWAAGLLDALGVQLRVRNLKGPVALVSDDQVGELYATQAISSLEKAGYEVQPVLLPVGEQNKTLDSLFLFMGSLLASRTGARQLRNCFRRGCGGGSGRFCCGDLSARRSLGGSSYFSAGDGGCQPGRQDGDRFTAGKNLVGAFHPPALVLSDPQVLATLPETELRSGMAEIVKAAVIGDPQLFELCQQGWQVLRADLGEVVRRGMGVKIRIIQIDPYEKDQRAALNLGHTIGHAIERASGFKLRHGEAVSIGMVVEARLAERMGLAKAGLAGQIASTLQSLELPTSIPAEIDRKLLLETMNLDKKRAAGRVLFALPVQIGEVKTGCEVEDIESFILAG
jgi:3-dehydroquinate synthetase